jgi:hypothetical protein
MKLKPSVAAKYGRELAEAEHAAKMGIDPVTGEINEAVYGPKNVQFDPTNEMKEWEMALNRDQMQQQAMQAIEEAEKLPQPAPAVQEPEPMPEPMEEQEMAPEATEDLPPEDPEKFLEWTAEKMKEINPDAPNAPTLKRWKQMHGDIFVLNIPGTEYLFIYRYLKRQEFQQLQANPAFQKMTEIQQEDDLFNRCVLWPQMDPIKMGSLPAGIPSMLSAQIQLQSGFVDPVHVAKSTIRI